MGYPVMSRIRWSWGIELPDGNRILGTSPEDILMRWGSPFYLGWMAALRDDDDEPRGARLTIEEVRELVGRIASNIFGVRLPDDVDELSAERFLELLADADLIRLTRK